MMRRNVNRARGFVRQWRTAWLFALLLNSGVVRAGDFDEVTIGANLPANQQAEFYYRLPGNENGKTPSAQEGVFLLVPGFNEDGRMYLRSPAWANFADHEGLLVVSPNFHATLEEIKANKSYYNARLWSGEATLSALDQIAAKTGFKVDKILIFGFSAGAHFTNSFVLWKPERVKAFVCYSAAWWQEPTKAIMNIPGLILCGEDDERYDATFAFMQQGLDLGLAWVWRSYKGTDHVMTPKIEKMAQAFLAHYAHDEKPPAPGSPKVS